MSSSTSLVSKFAAILTRYVPTRKICPCSQFASVIVDNIKVIAMGRNSVTIQAFVVSDHARSVDSFMGMPLDNPRCAHDICSCQMIKLSDAQWYAGAKDASQLFSCGGKVL